MGYCRRHNAYNGNGHCEHCHKLFESLPAKWHPPYGGSVRAGYWECLRDTVEKQKGCAFYSAGPNGWCMNMYMNECTLTRK
jgi:hypothetical protein